MIPQKLPKTTTDEQKPVFRPRTPADATKRDSRQLAKTVQFRRVGWCAAGITNENLTKKTSLLMNEIIEYF